MYIVKLGQRVAAACVRTEDEIKDLPEDYLTLRDFSVPKPDEVREHENGWIDESHDEALTCLSSLLGAEVKDEEPEPEPPAPEPEPPAPDPLPVEDAPEE